MAACTARLVSKLSIMARLLVRERGPFLFRGEGLTEVKRLGQGPRFRSAPAGGMMADDFLEPPPHDLRKAHFIFRGETFCFAKELVRDLNLCFYHDGNLPASSENVNVPECSRSIDTFPESPQDFSNNLLRINFSDFPGHRNSRSECRMGILPMPFGGELAEERREP